MRPVWSGAVSFGLVTIPIKMYSATEDHSIRFRQIHMPDHGLVRNRKVCEIEDRELAPEEIGRAYEVSRDQLVPITDEDLDQLPLPTAKAIDVQAFVPEERLDAIRYGKPYYLERNGVVATKPYVLLREALKRSDKVAVAKFAFHGRERDGGEGAEPPHAEAPAEPKGKVVDLMSALQDSVRAAKQSRGEEVGEGEVREMRPKKKAPAKKATKKTAKKAPAKKRPASWPPPARHSPKRGCCGSASGRVSSTNPRPSRRTPWQVMLPVAVTEVISVMSWTVSPWIGRVPGKSFPAKSCAMSARAASRVTVSTSSAPSEVVGDGHVGVAARCGREGGASAGHRLED
ncbi:hypothetical protein SANT12839_099030 [Streptomyces antimycoticus]|uniref:Ku domain-containing protein n=1 Tax=Streptomyces antimycoticus TaxID=68175 RepID=A0A4D4KIM9_9ACTN|nr:Ku protein [Streptomyces antimycoticus]GDY49021.1 hypothetical protein SANT12839_099030 [Streptomyces antimycoticus]